MTDPLRNDLRLRLGAQLRSLRRRARLSGTALGARIGISQAKVSRIESGNLWPPLADVAAWLDACYVDQAEHQRVMALAEAIEQGVTTLRDLHRGSLEVRQLELVNLDAEATLVRHFHPSIVPGPFHTPAYARACIVAANLSGQRDVESAVKARMQRVGQARKPGATPYHALVTEAALRFVPAGAEDEMPAVWQSVLDSAAAEAITLQVLPSGAPMRALPTSGFLLYAFQGERASLVTLETAAAEITFSGADETEFFEIVWDRFAGDALSPADSIDFVRHLVTTAPVAQGHGSASP